MTSKDAQTDPERLRIAEERVSRVASLALNCERRAKADRAAAQRGGITLGEAQALLTRAENYDLTADGILRALDYPPAETIAADKHLGLSIPVDRLAGGPFPTGQIIGEADHG